MPSSLRLPTFASTAVPVLLLGCMLTSAGAHAAGAPGYASVHRGHSADAPLRMGLEQSPEAASRTEARESTEVSEAPEETSASTTTGGPEPAAAGEDPGGTRLPGMSGTPASTTKDLPLSAGVVVTHGGLALVPLTGVWGASRMGGDTRLGATASETAAGMLVGSMPARLLFFRPAAASGGRWAEMEVVAFGAGLVLTPPLAALGTWSLGELAFGRSRDPGEAYLGALGGAAAGALLGVAAHGLLMKLAGESSRLETERELIALGFIGAGATLGYQWAGGGPRAGRHGR